MKLWHCNECGRESKSEDGVAVLFHRCLAPRRSVIWTPPEVEGVTLEELWQRAFADLGGGTPSPSIEEARAETGASGRRKVGTGFRSDDDSDDGSEW